MIFSQKNNKENLQFFMQNLLHEYNSYISDKKTLSIETSDEDFERLKQMYNDYLNNKNDLFFELTNNEENRLFFRENVNYYETFFTNCTIKYRCNKEILDQLNKLYKETQKQK